MIRPLSVLVVDDSPSVRAVLRRFLNRPPELKVIGEAADGRAALDAVERLRPDVLLLDLVMPELDGYGVLEQLVRSGHALPTLLLTSRANRSEVRRAFEALGAGAVELVPKPEDPEAWRQLAATLPGRRRSRWRWCSTSHAASRRGSPTGWRARWGSTCGWRSTASFPPRAPCGLPRGAATCASTRRDACASMPKRRLVAATARRSTSSSFRSSGWARRPPPRRC
ncbi:MAG: response regulator [Thermoanaerobaculia bacterium]|nr:response regulator [Thermoanaerobaculia bacterium]